MWCRHWINKNELILIIEICIFLLLTGVVHSKNKFEMLNNMDEVCQGTFLNLSSIHMLIQLLSFKLTSESSQNSRTLVKLGYLLRGCLCIY